MRHANTIAIGVIVIGQLARRTSHAGGARSLTAKSVPRAQDGIGAAIAVEPRRGLQPAQVVGVIDPTRATIGIRLADYPIERVISIVDRCRPERVGRIWPRLRAPP